MHKNAKTIILIGNIKSEVRTSLLSHKIVHETNCTALQKSADLNQTYLPVPDVFES